eukprot:267839-Rhodomonas_salina.1
MASAYTTARTLCTQRPGPEEGQMHTRVASALCVAVSVLPYGSQNATQARPQPSAQECEQSLRVERALARRRGAGVRLLARASVGVQNVERVRTARNQRRASILAAQTVLQRQRIGFDFAGCAVPVGEEVQEELEGEEGGEDYVLRYHHTHVQYHHTHVQYQDTRVAP